MERVYRNTDEIMDKMKVVPVLDSSGLRLDVYLDGRKVGRIDKHNKEIRVNVKVADEEKAKGEVRLAFDVREGILTVDPRRPGASSYTISATSGKGKCMNNPDCESNSWEGPIPRGIYRIDVSELDNPGLLKDLARNAILDWGDWRVTLHPVSVKTKRSGFFLHGGSKAGSAGCIDIGGGIFGNESTDRLLKDLLSDRDGSVTLVVR
ncbi:MAG: DUF2778 domain-containing protein [Deltaproteobacteria bacterium]|nr:DUF2778 domain-containing protein [Deltaproteobacteria bacterium]